MTELSPEPPPLPPVEPMRRGRVSAVLVLVIVNTVIFIINATGPPAWPAWDYFVSTLTWEGLAGGRVWEVISYQFLHWSAMHLAFNMIALWYAGRELEEVLGIPKFLVLYLVCGAAGGLAQVCVSQPGVEVLGASASVCGVLAAFSAMYSEMRVTVFILVFPVNARAKWIGRGILAASLFFILTGWLPGIGHAAHFGGAVAGYLIAWLYGYRPRMALRWPF